jgi:antitoxin PrlF
VRALRTARRNATLATLTSKGRITIPKCIREALRLEPGAALAFSVNADGAVVLHQRCPARKSNPLKDRFDAVRGSADVRWRTDDLMKLLRAGAS